MKLDKLFNDFYTNYPTSISDDTKRLELVPLTEESLQTYFDDLWDYSKIPEFYDYLEYPPFSSIEECNLYFNQKLKAVKNQNDMFWLIILKKEDKAIGTIRLTYWDLNRKITLVGYGISSKYGRKGYFSEALLSIIKYAFDVLGFHRIESWTRSDNIGSIKGLKKIGFVFDGCLRDYLLDYKNNRHDAVIYSLLKTDRIF